MAKSKKRKKTLIFGVIGLVLAGLTTAAILKKRDVVITVQTEKVERRNLTEIVVANGVLWFTDRLKDAPRIGRLEAKPSC